MILKPDAVLLVPMHHLLSFTNQHFVDRFDAWRYPFGLSIL
jgi:hypothetical protein